MKELTCIFGLLCAASFLAACGSDPANTFTLTGEHIAFQPETPSFAEQMQAAGVTSLSLDEEDEVDLSTALVLITHEKTNRDGEVEVITLASGNLVDGNVKLVGAIDSPTTVEISVDVAGQAPLPMSTVLSPGDDLKFALLDQVGTNRFDKLVMVGSSRRVLNPERSFAISGDLGDIERDWSLATVHVVRNPQYQDEELVVTNLGTALLTDGKFLVEAEIAEPTVVRIMLQAGPGYWKMAQAIAEPNAHLTVHAYGGDDHELFAKGSGRHAAVLESWESGGEYLALVDEFLSAVSEHQAQQRAAGQNGTRLPTIERRAIKYSLAAGCEHLQPENVIQPLIPVAPEPPSYWNAHLARTKMQSDSLKNIALNDDDPMNQLLALELGAFGQSREAVQVYDEIAEKLDEDLVVRRVTNQRNQLAARIETAENNSILTVGQKAPPFTLPDLAGKEVSLSGVLAANKTVFVDFWASWCGPCIAAFPELKEMYSAYNDDGFEIVGISIDSNFEDWDEATMEHEIPWLNLGEISENSKTGGSVSTTYGAISIPKGYVLDSQGCVIGKDIFPDKLKEFLVDHYGESGVAHEGEYDTSTSQSDAGASGIGG